LLDAAATGAVIVGDGAGLALELDDDTGNMLGALEEEDHAARHVVEVGVERRRIVQDDSHRLRHGHLWKYRRPLGLSSLWLRCRRSYPALGGVDVEGRDYCRFRNKQMAVTAYPAACFYGCGGCW